MSVTVTAVNDDPQPWITKGTLTRHGEYVHVSFHLPEECDYSPRDREATDRSMHEGTSE